MEIPAIPDDEQQRLQALHDLQLLDTPAEERFDRLTRLAKQMFAVPIALVSLVDEQRQWFKSSQGLDACETGRDVSFCGHAILGREIFEVCDASKDPRFADNPLVTGAPHIHFYAGAPLITGDGYGLGTLCIIDSQPRQLNADERRALRDLADIVVSEVLQIEQRKQSRDLKAARQLAEVIARAQSQFIHESDRRRAFDKLLADILDLTASEYGFIGEVLRTDEGAPYLKTYAITNIAWNDETRTFYEANAPRGMEFSNLNTLFGAALTSGEPVIANDPYHDSRRGGLPEGHPALNAFLGIPIHHGNELVAMLGIANRHGGYDQDLIGYLSPLLTTIGQLVAAAQVQQRQQADAESLSASEQRLASVIEGTHIGTWEWNVQTGETVFNQRWAEIVGYSLDELSPISIKTWMDLAHPEDLERSGGLLEQHFAGELEFYDCVARMRHKDGHWVWVHDRGRVVSWTADGKPLLMSGTHADVTDQKQAEQALQASEARLRGLFELSPIGIALNDYESGAFVDLNEALLEPTGYSRDEFTALSYWEITPREYELQEKQQLENMDKAGRYGPYEKEYIRKDGSRYPVLLNGMVVYDSNGRKLIWSIIEDISERKRIDRMKNEFISTVSHELRTPLTAISGALGLVVGGAAGALPAQMQQMLEIAHKNSQRLGVLINDLLDMEKLVAGKMRFNMQVQALQPLLEQAIQDNQVYADSFGVRLHLDQGVSGIRVKVDSHRLYQVLANLFSNAAKFSPEGGEVRVLASAADGRVLVSVTDRGPGIPEA
ncbi:MAG: PAS domain S-box protein, partial [Alcanivoracaceae bacterium]|nr:PAS domain S-box protein [Alcanivoracaceae bacterium]